MEVVITIDELRRAGVNVIVVPVRKRLQVDACQGVGIVADAPISDCVGADFDLILLPGGMPGAATLGDGDILESMVKKHADDGQLYARFRVAPAVALGSWGLMHGLKVIGYPSFMEPALRRRFESRRCHHILHRLHRPRLQSQRLQPSLRS